MTLDREPGPVAAPLEISAVPRLEPGAARARGARRRRIWALALTAAVLAGAAIGGWRWWGADRAQGPAPATAMVERADIEDSVPALGTLQPLDFVDVGTQVSGQLRKVHVEVGATVRQGDLLAEIDPTVYLARVEAGRAQLLNLRAQRADKEAQFALAQQQFQRQANLRRAGATSEEAYQSAEAATKSVAAQIEALKAQAQNTESTLRADEANLGYTKIYAPMSGTVVSQTAKQGQTLNANQQAPIILRIADLLTMSVTTQVSEADVVRLRIGMEAYFTTLGRPDRRWRGRLQKILPTPEILNNVVLYNASFDVPNPGGELMTQMTAQVFFIVASAKDALVVPLAALQFLDGAGARRDRMRRGGEDGDPSGGPPRHKVQVMRDDGTIEDRPVRVGVTNRIAAQIIEGVGEGERVVLGAPPALAPAAPPRPPRLPRLS